MGQTASSQTTQGEVVQAGPYIPPPNPNPQPNVAITSSKCTPGYYCTPGSSAQIVCPPGYYCPEGSAAPIACAEKTYCPQKSAVLDNRVWPVTTVPPSRGRMLCVHPDFIAR
jgi:hypothetical protein